MRPRSYGVRCETAARLVKGIGMRIRAAIVVAAVLGIIAGAGPASAIIHAPSQVPAAAPAECPPETVAPEELGRGTPRGADGLL
jgi:hypothetical protein